MARGLNHALLVGTVVRTPELRYTPAGMAVLQLDLAGDDDVLGDDGELRRSPWYQRVTVFGTRAEAIVERAGVAEPVLVEGHLERRSWHTDAGERRSSLDVVGDRVEVLEWGPRGEDATTLDARGQERLRNAANRVRILGNLARDAETRTTEGGHALARFTVAVDERSRERRDDGEGRTHFVDVRAWRDLAEACEALDKGGAVYVEGRLVTDRWEDGEGKRRFATRVEAHRVEMPKRMPPATEGALEVPATDATSAQAGGEVPF